MNNTNTVWQDALGKCLVSDLVTHPRGAEIQELIGAQYRVNMPAYITLESRKVNYNFMFAEAWWILSGSNRVSDIEPYMGVYKRYSDDGIFLRGAYGPKIIDQLGYVVDTLIADKDSRQAVINIWRERPGSSRDIPCTLSMQFLIRDDKVNCVVTMRSNDVVKGFTYDVWTFSMVSLVIKLLLKDRGIEYDLGELIVNAGSLHLYSTDKEKAEKWIYEKTVVPFNNQLEHMVDGVTKSKDYTDLLINLERAANVKY
jgi:thymidylate synthase